MSESNTPISEQINVWHEDEVVESEMLTQELALKDAPAVYEGYIMIPLVVDK